MSNQHPPEPLQTSCEPDLSSSVKSTEVHELVKPEATIIDARPATLSAMGGKIRAVGQSTQLQRARWLILQLETGGHPEWGRDDPKLLKGVTQAELARRTGLTTSYLNAIKHPERSGNNDIGASKLALMAKGVGLEIAYFYDAYEGERPFPLYLLSAKRSEKRIEAIVDEQRAQRIEFAKLRQELAERDVRHAREVAALENELGQARRRR